MAADVLTSLRGQFGFDQFKPGQDQVIGHLLAGRSAAAVFPTGGGKSLCYQLPALMLPELTKRKATHEQNL
jgi:ATP-dependent DNA helicase RecQ